MVSRGVKLYWIGKSEGIYLGMILTTLMRRKVVTAWLCSAILFSFIMIVVEIAPRVEGPPPTTIYVDDDYIIEDPWHKKTIQAAIDNASDGDTVFVFNGTYYENVVVDKTINLTGISKENTTIDGGGSGNVVYVNVNWVNITGFTITNGTYGMLFDSSSNDSITNNNIISNKGLPAGYGIIFSPSSNNILTNNNVSNNDNGIYFSISSNIKIEGNKISSNDDTSIWFDVVSNSTIINNNISMNGGYGISLVGSSSNTITGNNASNNRIGIDLGLSSNNTIKGNNASSNNQDGIHLFSSSNNDITHNNVYSNIYKGILLEESSNNMITDNNVSMSSLQAIYLDSSSGNNITNNNVSNNYGNGIVVHESSNNNNISGNDVYSNDNTGIIIYSSSYNEITNNDVISNYYTGVSVYSSSSNNNISHNDVHSNIKYGIYLSSSLNNNITQNNVSNHENGIFLHLSPENNVTDNMIFSNTNNGIYIGSTSDNDIIDNTISDNGRGVIISSSSNNNILGNIILNNLHSIYLYMGSSNNVINNNSLLGNLVAIYATSSTNIDARYNYFGTNYENRMEKLIYSSIDGEVDFSNWLPNRESGVQYIDGIVTWDSPITLNRGVIVNGTLTISSNVTFDNPFGHNFIHVNGTMNIDFANFTSNAGEYAIIYLNDTNGDITYSTFIGQKFVGSHRGGFNIKGNKFTLGREGLDLWKAKYNNITANNISSNRARGIYLQFSQNNSLTDNDILNNDLGIRIYQSSINNIQNNNISWCSRGLEVTLSSNNTITKNRVTNNGEGIITFHSNDNTITGNNILYNDYGIMILSSSSNNRIYHNNIIKNINQAWDSNNASFWNDSYPSGGNFWSDYAGVDDYHGPDQNIPGNDGIGDSPYIYIGGGSGAWDNYPLMNPFGNYTFLYEGWNLISVPKIQTNTSLITVLSSIEDSYDAVRIYNSTDTSDQWKHYKIDKSFGNDLTEIDHKMGFWIHINEPGGVLFEYLGIKPSVSKGIQLRKGWNLVGYPSLTSYNRTNGLNNTEFGNQINAIYWYEASSKTWHSMEETDYFKEGTGYWFHAKEDVVWHVPL